MIKYFYGKYGNYQYIKRFKKLGRYFSKLCNADFLGRKGGLLFEYFAKLYFENEPSISGEYKNVWLFSEVALETRNKLGAKVLKLI